MQPIGLDTCTNDQATDNNCNEQSDEQDRPFKKAKYAWQVKGKYHLKGNSSSLNECLSDPVITDNNRDSVKIKAKSSSSMSNKASNNRTPNCCIRSLINRTESLLDSEDSSDEDDGTIMKIVEIPATLVEPISEDSDYYVTKWQAKQIARGYLDNSINEVLEKWMTIAPPIDVPDFVDNCEGDDEVEDEGILMAIQSHGLQSCTQYLKNISNAPEQRHSLNQERASRSNIEDVQSENFKWKNEDESKENCMEIDNHSDFLNAAVAVAIQKKGLSSQSYL